MEIKKTFKTKTGFCHILPDKIRELGTDTFQIKHPKKNGELRLIEIKYRENGDGFSFKK